MASSAVSTQKNKVVEINVNQYASTSELTKLANGIERADSSFTVRFVEPTTALSIEYLVSSSYRAFTYSCDVSSGFKAFFSQTVEAVSLRSARDTSEQSNDIPMQDLSDKQRFLDKWNDKKTVKTALNKMVSELNNEGRHGDLWAAASSGDRNTLEQQLKAGVSVDKRDQYSGDTALMMAVKNKRYDCVRLLLDYDASTRCSNAVHITPIAYAIQHFDEDMLELLLNKQGSTRVTHYHGDYVFFSVCRMQSEKMMESFLSRDKELLNFISHQGETALMLACNNGYSKTVQTLLKHNADVNKGGPNGDLPLHTAVRRGDKGIVEALMDAGADAQLRDSFGKTALEIAREYKYIDDRASLVALVSNITVPDEVVDEWEYVQQESQEERHEEDYKSAKNNELTVVGTVINYVKKKFL
ncbi:ankyrin repeat domain-containing protein [Parashewanella curva]|uniref:Ankyrin repeat domain-containing protein n=1 Tax=Parashewanella curva TaxID=2338552 RepID=A0A3L8Q059_9GAMM|nr:ankyrin repeat domain-containing protein [Parashewanella curva]RLV60163.1 ankyrin repeat domain-containing protein [Parashewanella curva]